MISQNIIDEIIERFILDENHVLQLTPHTQGSFFVQNFSLGMGVSGLSYCLELLLKSQNNKKIQNFNYQYANNLVCYLQNASTTDNFKLNPFSHGFAAGAAGAIPFLTLYSLRTENDSILNNYINCLSEIYLETSLEHINNSFYGGTAGLIYCYLFPQRFNGMISSVTSEKTEEFLSHLATKLITFSEALLENKIDNPKERSIGFAWGLSGISYALLLLSKEKKDSDISELGKRVIALEDELLKNKSNTANPNSQNDDWIIKNALCVGKIGQTLTRRLLDPKNNSKDISFIQSALAKDITKNFTYCCGFSGLAEFFPNEQIKNLDIQLDLKSYLESNDDLTFLSGLTGYLYFVLTREDDTLKLFSTQEKYSKQL